MNFRDGIQRFRKDRFEEAVAGYFFFKFTMWRVCLSVAGSRRREDILELTNLVEKVNQPLVMELVKERKNATAQVILPSHMSVPVSLQIP